jgi:hypothetical protein
MAPFFHRALPFRSAVLIPEREFVANSSIRGRGIAIRLLSGTLPHVLYCCLIRLTSLNFRLATLAVSEYDTLSTGEITCPKKSHE